MLCCSVSVWCFGVVFWCGVSFVCFAVVFCCGVLVCCFGTVFCCVVLLSLLVGRSLKQTSEKCHRQVWVHDQGKHCHPSRGAGQNNNNNKNVGSRK